MIRTYDVYLTLSVPLLLMSWQHKEPGHHRPWYWRQMVLSILSEYFSFTTRRVNSSNATEYHQPFWIMWLLWSYQRNCISNGHRNFGGNMSYFSISTVPADGLAPSGARSSAGTVICHVQVLCLLGPALKLICPWTKWPPFRRRYFQMHFRQWKVLYFD